jgi:thiamine biosynthesis lipoprotein
MKSHCVELRRARPLLGTIVDIQARAPNELKVMRAIEDAFEAVERVHRLMSFHDRASDVSRLNREAHRRVVTVDEWTGQVLQAAYDFADESNGAFDVTVGHLLAEWDFLPRPNRCHPEPRTLSGRGISRITAREVVREIPRCVRNNKACWRDIVLEKDSRVRFRRRLTIDLGGIAKGFAVDCAIGALRNANVEAGLVNAGGDLRVFGLREEAVHIRSPLNPGHSAGMISLKNRALATSATYFSRKKSCGQTRSALIDGRTRQPFVDIVSITVAADDCMTADALTKIVFGLRDFARPILTHHTADAVILERDFTPRRFSPDAS